MLRLCAKAPCIGDAACRFDQLQSTDTAGVSPSIHAGEQRTELRPDQQEAYSARLVPSNRLSVSMCATRMTAQSQHSSSGTPLLWAIARLWHETLNFSCREQLLQQAPLTEKSYIRVPKIATGADAAQGMSPCTVSLHHNVHTRSQRCSWPAQHHN